MSEKTGYDNPPAYDHNRDEFSAQYGADFGVGAKQPQQPQPGAYPPQSTAYPPQGGAYPAAQGVAYAPQAGFGQPGYGQQSTTAVIVSQPGVAGHVVLQARPPDYMISSIIACLCCFWPTGLCAIYYASQATQLASIGDMQGATQMSKNSRNLMISSVVIGIIWITLVIVLRVIVYSNTNSYKYNY